MTFREIFYINKSDRIAFIGVLAMILLYLGFVFFFGGDDDLSASSSQLMSEERTTGDQDPHASQQAKDQSYYAVPVQEAERFAFDPNTADSTQLLRLGLQPWQVRSIYRYRSKGGVFREPSDFARLYGLTQKQYRELLPYIRISADYRPAAELVGPRSKSGFYASSAGKDEASSVDGHAVVADKNEATAPARVGYPVKLKAGEHVDLNLADTTALKQVPGIGSYYARRIASYGKQLGGYVSAEQLLEIEGFPEDALPYFQVATGNIHKLNINTLSLSKLRQHPYLNFYQARAICDYRRLKGPLHSLDDLKMLPEFPADVIARLRPYVSFE